MPSEAPSPTIRLRRTQLTLRIAGCVTLFMMMYLSPALYGQQHASPIPAADRKSAPAFELVSEGGTKLKLSAYRGKVILLNFWATDCGGCVLEIPSFIELEKAYKDKGFTAVGVSMDISYESLKDANEAWGRVRPFISKHGVNYPIAMGNDAISTTYALNAFPATYLINKYSNRLRRCSHQQGRR